MEESNFRIFRVDDIRNILIKITSKCEMKNKIVKMIKAIKQKGRRWIYSRAKILNKDLNLSAPTIQQLSLSSLYRTWFNSNDKKCQGVISSNTYRTLSFTTTAHHIFLLHSRFTNFHIDGRNPALPHSSQNLPFLLLLLHHSSLLLQSPPRPQQQQVNPMLTFLFSFDAPNMSL